MNERNEICGIHGTADMASESKKDVARRCYTVDEVGVILGVSRAYVYQLLKQKEFKWFRLGQSGRYRISATDFDSWLEHNT